MAKDQKQQELYTIFVAQCVKILKQMDIPQTPEGIAGALVNAVIRVETEGDKRGLKFDLAIKFKAGQELLSFVLQKLGMEVDEQTVQQIVKMMVGMYLQKAVASGRMTKEEVAKLAPQGNITGQMMGAQNG